MDTIQTPNQATPIIKKKSIWSTLIWIGYFISMLATLSNFFLFLTLRITDGKDIITSSDGTSISLNASLIATAITLIIYSILTVYCIKRKKSTLKLLPVLEVILYFVGIASAIIIFQLNDLSMAYLLGPIISGLIRPAIAIFVMYKNKADYIS